MKTTKVFEKNILAYQAGENLIINQGGTSSSKTYSVLQLLFLIAKLQKKARVISVVSYAFPHLRLGAVRDFDNILLDAGIIPGEVCNKTEMTYHIGNSLIEFFGTENLGKVHGPRRDILFINEANNVKHDIYTQLAIRTRECTFIDYNPVQSFWVQDEIIPKFKHTFIKSTYADNNFLDANTIMQIEARRTNENWWKVYGLGELGTLEGAILTNWRYGAFDDSLPSGFGMDFGFNDPDVLVKVAIDDKNKKIYCDEKIYKSGNSAGDLRQLMQPHCDRNAQIIADCADARMIAELSRYFNIKPVDKSKWTVVEALKMMQDYEIIITENSFNIAKELQNYIWSDKKAGIPLSGFDHSIDSIRYRFQHHIAKSTLGHQKWRG
jgi:phage terminase large subunit